MKNPLGIVIGRAFNFASFDVFAFYLKILVSKSLKVIRFSAPKSHYMVSLKRLCLKNFSTYSAEVLCEDVKLMLIKVPYVSRQYLPSFLSY